MAITELAEGTDAEHLGELIGFFGIPLAGLILLIVGLVRRSHNRRQRASEARWVNVVKRDDDSSDAARCPAGSRAFSYPNPARLYCLERLAH